MDASVCAITVTYSSRYKYIFRMLESLKAAGVGSLIIYDNNEKSNVASILDDEIEITQLGGHGNVGTARAFSEAINKATTLGFDFALLLDDDNYPEPNALNMLLAESRNLLGAGVRVFALSCERDGFNLASRWLPRKNYSKYVNVSLFGSPNQSLERRDIGILPIRNAPYGGLFLPLWVIYRVGLPREDFFVYVDDLEFTSRISAEEEALFLCVGARVNDREPQGARVAIGTDLASYDSRLARVYYSTRNQIFFDKQNRKNRVFFFLNRCAFLLRFLVRAVFFERSFSYAIAVLFAVLDGERSSLGRKSRFNVDGK